MRWEIIQNAMSLLPRARPYLRQAGRVRARSARKNIASAASAAIRQSTWKTMMAAEARASSRTKARIEPSRGRYSMRDRA